MRTMSAPKISSLEDCRRERVRVRERENRSPGEGEVAFYASKTDINHVSI